MPESDWPADVYFGDAEKPLPDWRKESPEEQDEDAPPTKEERAAVRGILGFDPGELEEEEEGKGMVPRVRPSPLRNRKRKN